MDLGIASYENVKSDTHMPKSFAHTTVYLKSKARQLQIRM